MTGSIQTNFVTHDGDPGGHFKHDTPVSPRVRQKFQIR
jgi:hypothetical protein